MVLMIPKTWRKFWKNFDPDLTHGNEYILFERRK